MKGEKVRKLAEIIDRVEELGADVQDVDIEFRDISEIDGIPLGFKPEAPDNRYQLTFSLPDEDEENREGMDIDVE